MRQTAAAPRFTHFNWLLTCVRRDTPEGEYTAHSINWPHANAGPSSPRVGATSLLFTLPFFFSLLRRHVRVAMPQLVMEQKLALMVFMELTGSVAAPVRPLRAVGLKGQ